MMTENSQVSAVLGKTSSNSGNQGFAHIKVFDSNGAVIPDPKVLVQDLWEDPRVLQTDLTSAGCLRLPFLDTKTIHFDSDQEKLELPFDDIWDQRNAVVRVHLLTKDDACIQSPYRKWVEGRCVFKDFYDYCKDSDLKYQPSRYSVALQFAIGPSGTSNCSEYERILKESKSIDISRGRDGDIQHRQTIDLMVLKNYAENLTNLSVIFNPIESANVLPLFSNLEYLNLQETSIDDFGFVSELEKLKVLKTRIGNLSNLGFVDQLSELEELDLTDQSLTTIEGIDSLKKLKFLRLSENYIEDFLPLEKLSQLVELKN